MSVLCLILGIIVCLCCAQHIKHVDYLSNLDKDEYEDISESNFL